MCDNAAIKRCPAQYWKKKKKKKITCCCKSCNEPEGKSKSKAKNKKETTVITNTTAHTTHVVNELLAYIMFHYMECTENDIKLVILDFYDPLTINDAKRAMWEHCGELLPPFESRRSSPVGGSAHEKDLNDIMFAVKEIDKRDCNQTTLPVFVAVRLDNLPRMTPGEVDPISLLERVTMLETSMRNVQKCVTRHDSALAAVTHTATRNSQRTELIDPRVKLSLSCIRLV